MTLVLRIVRQARWDSPRTFDWLGEGDVPADPLGDFANTDENCLSVYFLNDDRKELNDVAAALAAGREKGDTLDYVLFPQRHIDAAGIEVLSTTGRTLDDEVNGLHRDLVRLSAQKVLALTASVWRENLEVKRLDKESVLQLVTIAVCRGRMSLEKLRPKLREDVRKRLGRMADEPRLPR